MSPQSQPGGSPTLSSIEVRSSSDTEEYDSETQQDGAMDSSVAMSDVVIRDSQIQDEEAAERSSGPGYDGAPASRAAGVRNGGARFRGGSQGPLGALAAVNNKQILSAQAREAEELVRSISAGDGQASMSDDHADWAGLHADLKKLIKDKETLREYAERTTEKVELRHNELQDWITRFSTIADVGSGKLVSTRDKLPANLGPALLRLSTFYYQDDDSIDKLPNRYKDLLGKDLRLLAQKALPPVPSQDISVLRRDLQSARVDATATRKIVVEKDKEISELSSDNNKKGLMIEGLQTRVNNLIERYEAASERVNNRMSEVSRSESAYKNKCEQLREGYKRQKGLLVGAEEEKQRLLGLRDDALKVLKQRDDRIKQLNDQVELLATAQEGSASAYDALKRTVSLLNEQGDINELAHKKIIDDQREKARSEQDRQQRKITQLECDVERLERENGRIQVLEEEKRALRRQATTLNEQNSRLVGEKEALTSRSNAVWDEKSALEKRNAELDVAVGEMGARFDELNNSYTELQASEASLIEKVGQLKKTIRDNDSVRDVVVRDLRSEVNSWETKHDELQNQNNSLRQDAKVAERAITAAQVQLQRRPQLEAEAARCKSQIESLSGANEDARTKLMAAEDEKRTLSTKLGTCTAEIDALRDEHRGHKAEVDRLAHERSKEREKVRLLEQKLHDIETDHDARLAAVTSLEAQLNGRTNEVMRLAEEVATFGAGEAENQQFLEAEREKMNRFAQENTMLKDRISEQRLRADESRERLQRSIDAEKVKVQQLEHMRTEVNRSVDKLRKKQVEDAGSIGGLEASLQHEKDERQELQKQVREGEKRMESLKEQHQMQLAQTQAQLNMQHHARQTLMGEVEGQKEEARGRDAAIKQLEAQVSVVEGSLSGARRKAEESILELQGFLARLCLSPPEDVGMFEGLAREVQTPSIIESHEPSCELVWTILETWDVEAAGEAIQLPKGLEMLVLGLFRNAILGRVGTRECHLMLQQTIDIVSAGTIIHAGTFGEMAKAFAQAVTARPEEGFQTGLVLWQLLDAVEHRWEQVDLKAVKADVARALEAHEYRSVFEVVSGRGQLQRSGECRFFSDTLAVVARVAAPSAVLVDTAGRTVRFFAKSRWTAGLRGFTIEPPGQQDRVFLQSNSVQDLEWAGMAF